VESEFLHEGDGFGSTGQEAVGAEIDGSTGEGRGGEGPAPATARFDHFDAWRGVVRSVDPAGEFPRGRECADAPADDDDGRAAHLGGRVAHHVGEYTHERRVIVE